MNSCATILDERVGCHRKSFPLCNWKLNDHHQSSTTHTSMHHPQHDIVTPTLTTTVHHNIMTWNLTFDLLIQNVTATRPGVFVFFHCSIFPKVRTTRVWQAFSEIRTWSIMWNGTDQQYTGNKSYSRFRIQNLSLPTRRATIQDELQKGGPPTSLRFAIEHVESEQYSLSGKETGKPARIWVHWDKNRQFQPVYFEKFSLFWFFVVLALLACESTVLCARCRLRMAPSSTLLLGTSLKWASGSSGCSSTTTITSNSWPTTSTVESSTCWASKCWWKISGCGRSTQRGCSLRSRVLISFRIFLCEYW